MDIVLFIELRSRPADRIEHLQPEWGDSVTNMHRTRTFTTLSLRIDQAFADHALQDGVDICA
jgi:hypothetical protein